VTVNLIIDRGFIGTILGKQGASVTTLQQETGCHLHINPPIASPLVTPLEQIVKVGGRVDEDGVQRRLAGHFENCPPAGWLGSGQAGTGTGTGTGTRVGLESTESAAAVVRQYGYSAKPAVQNNSCAAGCMDCTGHLYES
jgi:hypothetical protein